MKKIAAVVLALAVIASFASLFTVSAADPVNLAVGKTVTSNATCFAPAGGKLENAVDGKRDGSRTLCQWNGANVWIDVDLGSSQTVNKVVVVFDQYKDNGNLLTVRDLAIDVKVSEGNYKRVAEVHYDAQPGSNSVHEFTFEAVETTAVRVTGNKANSGSTTFFSLSEIEIYNDSSVAAPYTGVNAAKDIETVIPKYQTADNLAKDATVTSNVRQYSGNDNAAHLNDGNRNSRCIGFFQGHLTTSVLYYNLELKEAAEINTVYIFNDNTEDDLYAKSFAVDVQDEDGYWVRVAEYHGLEVTAKGVQYTISFETIKAKAVRVTAHADALGRQSADQQDRIFSLAEIEIYKFNDVTEAEYAKVNKDDDIVIEEYSPKRPANSGNEGGNEGGSSNSGSTNSGSTNSGSTNSGSTNSGSSNKVPSKNGDNSNVVAVMVALVAAGFVCVAAAKAQKA